MDVLICVECFKIRLEVKLQELLAISYVIMLELKSLSKLLRSKYNQLCVSISILLRL